MGRIKNVMSKIEGMKGKINKNYAMSFNNFREIRDNSAGEYELITNSFKFGYLQGMKAAKANQKVCGGGSHE